MQQDSTGIGQEAGATPRACTREGARLHAVPRVRPPWLTFTARQPSPRKGLIPKCQFTPPWTPLSQLDRFPRRVYLHHLLLWGSSSGDGRGWGWLQPWPRASCRGRGSGEGWPGTSPQGQPGQEGWEDGSRRPRSRIGGRAGKQG